MLPLRPWKVSVSEDVRPGIGGVFGAKPLKSIVVLSPTVGEARWSPAVDENIGAAGLFAPPDRGLPDDGVIAVGELNRPGWVHAALDLDPLAAVRRGGDVLNFRSWEEQPGAHKNRIAELVRLR